MKLTFCMYRCAKWSLFNILYGAHKILPKFNKMRKSSLGKDSLTKFRGEINWKNYMGDLIIDALVECGRVMGSGICHLLFLYTKCSMTHPPIENWWSLKVTSCVILFLLFFFVFFASCVIRKAWSWLFLPFLFIFFGSSYVCGQLVSLQ